MAQLCWLSESGGVMERWAIQGRPLVVGRDEAADVRVDDNSLSRRHFQVLQEGGHFFVQDLSSSNGTSVNGEFVKQTLQLGEADVICAGHSLFLFQGEQAEHPGPVRQAS